MPKGTALATEAELYDLLDRFARAHSNSRADIRDDAACERAGDRLILAMDGPAHKPSGIQ